jgi:large subunit ribosomal protein L10
MVKPEKIESIKSIRSDYEAVAGTGGSVIFAAFTGLEVEQIFKLRKSLREKSVRLRVLKNTLVRRALEESGVSGIAPYLKGPTVVAFSPDEVSASKVMSKFAKEISDAKKSGKFEIKGGVLGGKPITSKEVEVLAALPSREEVMAMLLALINAPATNLLRLISEPGNRVARVLKAASEKPGAQTDVSRPLKEEE